MTSWKPFLRGSPVVVRCVHFVSSPLPQVLTGSSHCIDRDHNLRHQQLQLEQRRKQCVCVCVCVVLCMLCRPRVSVDHPVSTLVADARIELSEQRGSLEVVVPCYAFGRFKSSSDACLGQSLSGPFRGVPRRWLSRDGRLASLRAAWSRAPLRLPRVAR